LRDPAFQVTALLDLGLIRFLSEDHLDPLSDQLVERHDRQQQREHGDDRGDEEPEHILSGEGYGSHFTNNRIAAQTFVGQDQDELPIVMLQRQPNSTQSRYLPPPAAPDWIASRNRVTLSEPDTWLGGYSLNVVRNCPTICTAGTIVHNLSPHQRAYIID
jgi:hypothetical protein